jgi:hypothetical protein
METSSDELEELLAKYFRPRGTCQLCQKQDLKSAMAFHLGACLAQHQRQADGRPSPKYLLLVESREHPEHYWLYLEMVQQAKLARLDQFLRTLWLECCGHLSAFTIEGARYCIDAGMYGEEWDAEPSMQEEPMDVPIRRVLSPGQDCTYEYDYGSTTFLSIQVVAAYTGVVTGSSVRLLACNDPPRLYCIDYLRNARCLLVLDNVEAIFEERSRAGTYLEGYEGYGKLFQREGETLHHSCLLLTSQVRAVTFSLDGRTVISGSEDRTITSWNVQTGECLQRVRNRLYERMNITGIRGLTEAQKATLRGLGAAELETAQSSPSGHRLQDQAWQEDSRDHPVFCVLAKTRRCSSQTRPRFQLLRFTSLHKIVDGVWEKVVMFETSAYPFCSDAGGSTSMP